jgi:adenylate kinase family enzyme
MNNILKIGLIGSAGIGKSSIATELSKKLDLIFLKSKDITRPIMKKYNYDYSSGEYIEKFLSKKDIEFEIVDSRTCQESLLKGGFITDRTTLECFAYALLSVEKYADDEIIMLERICKENMKNYTHIFYFPSQNGWLEDNGIRTVNTYFQWKIDLIIRGLLDDWNVNAITINDDNPIKFILNKI